MLISNRVGFRIRIRFSVQLVSTGYADVFVLLFVVIVTLPLP